MFWGSESQLLLLPTPGVRMWFLEACRKGYGGVALHPSNKNWDSQLDGPSPAGVGQVVGWESEKKGCGLGAASGEALGRSWKERGLGRGLQVGSRGCCSLGYEWKILKTALRFQDPILFFFFFFQWDLTTNLEPPGRRGPPCLELWNCKVTKLSRVFFQALHLCPKSGASRGLHGSSAWTSINTFLKTISMEEHD